MPANTHYRVITIICLGLLSDEQPTVSSSIQFDDPRTYLTTVCTSTISSSLSSFGWGFLMCMSTHTLSTIGPDTPDHLIAFFSSLLILSRDNFWHRVAIQKDVNKNSTCSIKQGMYLLTLIVLALTGLSEITMQEKIGTHSSWVVDQSVTDIADLVDLTGFALVGVAAAVERRGGIFVSGRLLIERTEPNVTCCLQANCIARYLHIFGKHQHRCTGRSLLTS